MKRTNKSINGPNSPESQSSRQLIDHQVDDLMEIDAELLNVNLALSSSALVSSSSSAVNPLKYQVIVCFDNFPITYFC